jgi:pimeloyl-ACP methyl ester carboxylesterase
VPRPAAVREIAVCLLAVVAFAACSGNASKARDAATTTSAKPSTTTSTTKPSSSSSSTPAPPPFVPKPLEFSGCGNHLECATLTVPLDYDDPTGPTIDVSVNRSPARNRDQRIGSLLVNPGGPGASGIDLVKSSVGAFPAELRDRFDIVGFDPRGVGESNEVPCAGPEVIDPFRHADSNPDTAREQADLDHLAQGVAADCADHAGELLPHIGTDDVVRDIESIRLALGEDTISFAGFSYGTLLGLRYAELFPHGARAIMLDGVVDPAQGFTDFLKEQAIAFETQLAAAFAECPSSGDGCPDGGAAAAYDQIAQQVETDPLPADDGNSVGPNELAIAVTESLYTSGGSSALFRALQKGLEGDGQPLYEGFQAYEGSVHFASYAGVECIDSEHPVGSAAYRAFAADLERAAPRLGGAVANELLPCAYWATAVKNVVGPVAAHGAPPILVIGNTRDAATPYEQAQRVADGLEQATLLTLDSGGHTAFVTGNECIRGHVVTYFVDLTLPPEGTVCSP